MEAGAAGISFGRNLFGRKNPADFIARVRDTANANTLKMDTLTHATLRSWLDELVSAWEALDSERAISLCQRLRRIPREPLFCERG